MTITVNSTTVSNLATLFITILSSLEGFNWFSLFDTETAFKVVAGIGLAKLLFNFSPAVLAALTKQTPKE